MRNPERILISRTDSIGDVVLTLPMAGVLKEHFPQAEILFLGKEYTRPLIEACGTIDRFIDIQSFEDSVAYIRNLKIDTVIHVFPRQEIAALCKKAGIPKRIGSTGRLYHWFTCNQLVPLSRKNAALHESQLNLRLLSGLGIKKEFSTDEIQRYYGLNKIAALTETQQSLLDPVKTNLILHPLSLGSAREWGLENFKTLVKLLSPDDFKIFITGTEREGESIRKSGIFDLPNTTDLCGMFSLTELLSFIASADAMVAASTGPLHVAAVLGKHAIGIYPPIRPMHAGRWAPLGKNAEVFVLEKECNDCRNKGSCACMHAIKPEDIALCLSKHIK
ncbi:MAG: glycosyltransferase family 9 protein [Bacteroidota bacterium]